MKAKRNQLGCIAVLLFLALCGSVFFNVLFVVGKAAGGSSVSSLRSAEMPKFEEELVQPGNAESNTKIAQISLRGIISSSVPGDLGQTMVDDLKMQLRQ